MNPRSHGKGRSLEFFLNFIRKSFILQHSFLARRDDPMPFTKIKTGVPGLDEILKGGVREKSAILISGGPGTGKSILAMQFLAAGAKQGEAGLCILYDTEKDEFLDYADALGISIRRYEKSGKITILNQPLLIKKVASLEMPLQLIAKKKIKRVVLDSLTMFAYIHIADDRDYRKKVVEFLDKMNSVTLLATAEAPESNMNGEHFRPEDFLFDGLIMMAKIRQESSFERVLHVSKMKGQDHLLNIFPFSIGKGGIKVYPDQLPFALMEEKGKPST